MIFEKINITDVLVITGLIIALLMAIFFRMNELAMSIASGLIGYIGGTVRSITNEKVSDGGKK